MKCREIGLDERNKPESYVKLIEYVFKVVSHPVLLLSPGFFVSQKVPPWEALRE